MKIPHPLLTLFTSRSMRWFFLSVMVGLASGFAAVVFFLAVEYGKYLFLGQLSGLNLPSPSGEHIFLGVGETFRPWLIPVMTTTVGLFTGWLIVRFGLDSQKSGTDGTDAMINAFHNKEGQIKPRTGIIKGFTSILTIISGGSAGREGPISLVGATIGSWLANLFHLTPKERRILLLAGAAGGLGAIFRAPLGGAITAIEVIYREDFEAEAVLPSVISSVIAYSLFTVFFGTESILSVPAFHFSNPMELPFYIILAAFCSFTGWLHVKVFRFAKYTLFSRLAIKTNIMLATGLGGAVMGVLGMYFPQLLTGGHGWLELAVSGKLILPVMLGILLGKILATAITIGSGMSGGMFAPALLVGGMSGGIVGFTAQKYFPAIVTQPGGYVLVGMAAFFAGVGKAPIGPLIMVCELTRGYGLLAPLMLTSVLSIFLSKRTSLYENQVENKFESPAHMRDMPLNILDSLFVKDFFHPGRVIVVEESTTLKAMVDIMANSNALYFPVRNEKDEITGIACMENLRKALFEETLLDLIVVSDVAGKPSTLLPKDTLYTALMQFVDTDYGQIPVIHPDDPTVIVGLLHREDVFTAYSRTVTELCEEDLACVLKK